MKKTGIVPNIYTSLLLVVGLTLGLAACAVEINQPRRPHPEERRPQTRVQVKIEHRTPPPPRRYEHDEHHERHQGEEREKKEREER